MAAPRETPVVPLRDLKQNPSAIIARVEAGETIAITVRGHHAATMIPPVPERKPVTYEDVRAYYSDIAATADPERDAAWLAEIAENRGGWFDDRG